MDKIKGAQLVSANDLRTGEVCYLTSIGTWTMTASEAAITTSREKAARLLETAATHSGQVVEPHLIEVVRQSPAGIKASARRARIRMSGPSFHSPRREM